MNQYIAFKTDIKGSRYIKERNTVQEMFQSVANTINNNFSKQLDSKFIIRHGL